MKHLEITLGSLKEKARDGVQKMSIVLDGAGRGEIDDNIGVVSPSRRKIKAELFRRDFFDGNTMRPDVYRYLHFYYLEEETEPLYKDVKTLYALLQRGLVNDPTILEYVKYSVNNAETAQLLGFILIFTEMMEYAKKKRRTITLEFEEPFLDISDVGRFLDLIQLMIRDAKGFVQTVKI